MPAQKPQSAQFRQKTKQNTSQKILQSFSQDQDSIDSIIIYGRQIILFALACHPDKIQTIYLTKDIDKATFAKLKSKPIIRIDNKKAQALSRGGNHQGFLASISPLTPLALKDIKGFDKILVLYRLQDMGNIGGIFRSAYCLGVEAIILAEIFSDFGISKSSLKDKATLKNLHSNPSKNAQKLGTIIRASAGAAFDMPFCIVPNTRDMINELKEAKFTLLGASQNGEDISRIKESLQQNKQNLNKWALFLGSEDNGLCTKITKKFDKMLRIKMHRDFDSLNVSVAAGILMSYLLH